MREMFVVEVRNGLDNHFIYQIGLRPTTLGPRNIITVRLSLENTG